VDDLFNIIILLVIFLIPAISGIAKAIKGKEEKARGGTGSRRPVPPPPPRPLPSSPEPTPANELAQWFEEDDRVESEDPWAADEEEIPVAVLEPKPFPARGLSLPHSVEKADSSYETVLEHLESHRVETVSGSVKTDIEDSVRKDMDDAKWDRRRLRMGLPPDVVEKRDPVEKPVTGDASEWTTLELKRAVVMSEILGPPLAMRAPGEGPLAPRLET